MNIAIFVVNQRKPHSDIPSVFLRFYRPCYLSFFDLLNSLVNTLSFAGLSAFILYCVVSAISSLLCNGQFEIHGSIEPLLRMLYSFGQHSTVLGHAN